MYGKPTLTFTQASRKGNLQSCSGSVVNLMLESRLLMWVVNSSTWHSWIMVNAPSSYLSHSEEGWGGWGLYEEQSPHELRPGVRAPPIYDELLLSCDRRRGGHMTSDG